MTSPARRQPKDYADRDRAMLGLVRRLGVGLTSSLSRVFLDGKPSGHVLRRLEAKNLIEVHQRKIPGGISYATLSSQGLKAIGLEPRKPKELGSVALNTCIAVSWYCTLDEVRRYRLLSDEIAELFEAAAPKNVPHVVTGEFEEPVVLRVHHSLGKIATTKKHVEDFFDVVRTKPGLAPWACSLDYGLVVLCPTETKKEQVKDSFEKANVFARGRLAVSLGPTAETLAECLKRRRRGDG